MIFACPKMKKIERRFFVKKAKKILHFYGVYDTLKYRKKEENDLDKEGIK